MCKRGDNIHKRKDGRWEGRYQQGRKEDGSIRYSSVYGKTYTDVKEKLLLAQRNLLPKSVSPNKDKTFEEVLELWMENNRIRLKGGTVNKYQHVIDAQIIPTLGKIKISQLTSTYINSFLLQKLQDGRLDGAGALSAAYVKSIMLIISSAINFAVKEQFCTPLKAPIAKPVETKKELVILDKTEQKRLETFLIQDISSTKLGILLSLYTGLRIGETCALRWDDIDFNKKTLHVRHTIARISNRTQASPHHTSLILDTPKTKTSHREIPIPSALLPILKELYRISQSEYVISNKINFVSPRTYEYRYHKILEQCGIRSVNYHVLRHTFATRCIETGMDVKSLSEILGHANVGITLNTYVHSSIELKRSQLEKVFVINTY